MALWDLLGQVRGMPVYRLLGYDRAYKKTPYASLLFGNTAQETLERARASRASGFRAAKFGWGPFGTDPGSDSDHLDAAREGLGDDGILLVDAGQIWIEDVAAAAERLAALERNRVTWLEEPFHGRAYGAYAALARKGSKVKLAGGEAAPNRHMADPLLDFGRQIGRTAGQEKGVKYG